MATVGEIAVKDPASGGEPQVDGIVVTNAGANPSTGQALRQNCTIADGSDTSNYATVDSDGNVHVINGRVSGATASQVAASVTAVSLLASRAARVGVTIWNQGGSALYIGFTGGVTAGPTGTASWMVGAGQQWTMPVAYTGILYGIWDSTGGQANIADF